MDPLKVNRDRYQSCKNRQKRKYAEYRRQVGKEVERKLDQKLNSAR